MNEYNVINTSQKKSDWNASEGEAGFIKNRTHYEKVMEETNSTTVTVPSEWDSRDNPEYIYMTNTIDANFKQSLYGAFISDAEDTDGKPILQSSGKIRINGTEHDCYCYISVFRDNNGYIEWSVQYFDSDDYSSDGEYPYQNMYFSIYIESGDPEDYVEMSINTNYIPIGENNIELVIDKSEVKKIDAKFLPDMGGGLNNAKDAEFGGIIEGLINGSEGQINVASGTNAHAEGGSSHYDDYEGVTFYNPNSASGDASHAEGIRTNAIGNASHSEGSGAKASGEASHAEGSYTTATEFASHTEGSNTTASGYASHAEGEQTTSSGRTSHAEGNQTTASGNKSHTEGYYTEASGENSHAEGSQTKATVQNSHAEGYYTTASGIVSHAEGLSTTASGAYSHAEGYKTTASGEDSHAEGSFATASGNRSHAEGEYTTASGVNSHVEGYYTIANHSSQHVFGEYNIADPSNATADSRGTYVEIVGNGINISNRSNARTLDWSGNEVLSGKLTVGTQPTNDNDVATKKYVDDHSGGGGLNNAKDAENGGIIEGLINGEEGQINIASGQNAHAEGGWTDYNPDDGYSYYPNTASGHASHAEGIGTTASELGAHAEGDYTTASGYYSHAEGGGTIASGADSHAEGSSTTASGNMSHAEGYYTIANHSSQHVFGEYNIQDPSTAAIGNRGTYVEIVGNGSSNNNKSNARTLDWSGNEWLKGSITADGGLILKSPDGSSFTIHVANDGTLSAVKNV